MILTQCDHRQEKFFKVELLKTKEDLDEWVEFCIERKEEEVGGSYWKAEQCNQGPGGCITEFMLFKVSAFRLQHP